MDVVHQDSYYQSSAGLLTKEKFQKNDNTMVTIVCISYGHEKFISKALDSFISQKTTFKFKIFVGEDCGPDNTANIIREYAKKYPDLIIPFIRSKNMGAQRNLIDLCNHATSPYIAFCEGDDYWIDDYKLQKQYDLMESHKELVACGARCQIDAPPDWHMRTWYREIKGKLLIPDSIPNKKFNKMYYSSDELIEDYIAHTSTYFFRWNYDQAIPEWYYQGRTGDISILLLQTGNTGLGMLSDVVSTYRINDSSINYYKTRDEYILGTRLEVITFWARLKDYAEHSNTLSVEEINKRIVLETTNYLRLVIRIGYEEAFDSFIKEYPEEYLLALDSYIDCYYDERRLVNYYTWEGYKNAFRDPKCYLKMEKRVNRFLK